MAETPSRIIAVQEVSDPEEVRVVLYRPDYLNDVPLSGAGIPTLSGDNTFTGDITFEGDVNIDDPTTLPYLPLSGGTMTGTVTNGIFNVTSFNTTASSTIGPTSTTAIDPNTGHIFNIGGWMYAKRSGTGNQQHYFVVNDTAGTPTVVGALGTSGSYTMLSNEGSGLGILFRPTAYNSVTGQMIIAPDGLLTIAGQIKFPATQNASADATTLDDYEEGSWTPVIEGKTTAGAGTYSVQNGRYTKIGRLVFVEVSIVWSAHTGTGEMRIANLPFTVLTSPSINMPCPVWSASLTFTGQLSASFQAGTSTIDIFVTVSNTAKTGVGMDTTGTLVMAGQFPAA